MTWSWQVYTCQDHNLFYTTHDDHNCSLLYGRAVLYCIDDDICFLSGHLLCNPHIFHLVSLSLPTPAFYVTLIWIWAGKVLQFGLASSSKLFLIMFTRVLARGCGQEGWFYFCCYDVDTGQVFVFCVNWCLLGHIYKTGSVLCCWVSLFICVCIWNCYLWFTCFYYLCSALVLTLLLQQLLCIGWGHSDVIGIIKLEFCRVMV
jgi:hypothetical protein